MNGEKKTLCGTVSDSDATKQVIEIPCGGITGSALMIKGNRTTLCEVEVYGKLKCWVGANQVTNIPDISNTSNFHSHHVGTAVDGVKSNLTVQPGDSFFTIEGQTSTLNCSIYEDTFDTYYNREIEHLLPECGAGLKLFLPISPTVTRMRGWTLTISPLYSTSYPNAGLDSNYCRNPSGNTKTWCYSDDKSIRWGYCELPSCKLDIAENCKYYAANFYRGNINTSDDGTQCESYCRRIVEPEYPSISPTCYTDITNTSSDKICSITDICNDFTYLCGDEEDSTPYATYIGSYAVTETGWECRDWSDILDTATLDLYPTLQNNYCRNVNGSGLDKTRAWCYSTNPDTEFEFCSIPSCSDIVGTNSSYLLEKWKTEITDGEVTTANITCSATITLLDQEPIVHEVNVSIKEIPSDKFVSSLTTLNTMESLSDNTTCAQFFYQDGVYKCPVTNEAYQVSARSGGLCQFDHACSYDPNHYQTCGCSFVTVSECFCADCSDEDDCDSDSTVSSGDTFTCQDTTKSVISTSKQCNNKANCPTTTTISYNDVTFSVYNYEDEYGCTTSKYNDSCVETSSSSSNTVYTFQLCDGFNYEETNVYCDDKWKTWVNCTSDHSNQTNLYCSVDGYTTSIDETLECDLQRVCDEGEDEDCMIIDDVTTNYYRYINTIGTVDTMYRCPWGVDLIFYTIQSGKFCDGYVDCPVVENGYSSEEESACSSSSDRLDGSLSENTHVFAAPCLPGVMASSTCTMLEVEIGYGITKYLHYDSASFDCANVGGEVYVLAVTADLCDTLDYSEDLGTATEGLSGYTTMYSLFSNLTAVGSLVYDGSTTDTIFTCSNDIMIASSKVCDYINDCGDDSDEKNCLNRFTCESDNSTIKKTQMCDTVFDCTDKTDECDEGCKDSTVVWRMITTPFYRGIAITFGLFSLVVNFVSLIMFFKMVLTTKDISFSLLTNDILVALIALGDFSVGIYMVLVFSYDQHYGEGYCEKRLIWLSSDPCSFIGVVSTFGNQLSLLSMTLLSVFRLISIKTMMIFSSLSRKKLLLIVLTVVIIVTYSLAIGLIPILKAFEDYFVNGLYYEGNPVITDSKSKSELNSSFVAYLPGSGYNSNDMTWDNWRRLIAFIFQETDPSYTSCNQTFSYEDESMSIGFYGNSGVCLFKYFVKDTDPQHLYSIYVLSSNLVCFVIITISYALIIAHTYQTSKDAGTSESKQRRTSMRRLQRKISLIIATDFATWIPFITLSFLHYNDVWDGDDLYEFCSILLIPINSVLNPIIYNGDAVIRVLGKWNRTIASSLAISHVTQSMELQDMKGRRESRKIDEKSSQ
eukprot:sb/3461060/